MYDYNDGDYDEESGLVSMKCDFCNGYTEMEMRYGKVYGKRCRHCGEMP